MLLAGICLTTAPCRTMPDLRFPVCPHSRTSKAFSNKQTVKQCGCSEVYRDCLQTFLPALSCPVQKEVLRSGVRTFLHRMIICLEEEVLPFIPSASEHMLKDCEAKDLQEFIPLINQITAKFKVNPAKCCHHVAIKGNIFKVDRF